MFQLKNTIVSEEILDKEFICNLNACKGSCCVEGEAGAPLISEEGEILENIYPKIKGLLRKEAIDTIEKEGVYTTNPIGEFETTLIDGRECVYAIFDENGIVKCAIESAFKAGLIEFYKPISCHLYPIRVREYKTLTAVNYHSWPICNAACSLGKELKVPTYRFVKEALIRKFGMDWYTELDALALEYYQKKEQKKQKKKL